MIIIDSLMERHSVTHEELISHWEAHNYLSRSGSEAKLKNIPSYERDKIAKFYSECRRNGLYPGKPQGHRMIFGERISYEDAWKHSVKLQAPNSLAEMEPA